MTWSQNAAMYRLIIKESAEKQMEHLPTNVYVAVKDRIMSLRDEPRPHRVKKLIGILGWRIRVGDYRVIYDIDDTQRIVSIVAVKPRQSAYR